MSCPSPFPWPRRFVLPAILFLAQVTLPGGELPLRGGEVEKVDLLIVGGNEAGVAAAIQAARHGTKSILLVSDTRWLGGQFSDEAVGAIDEWTIVDGKRVNFPRSGLFLEVIERVRKHNELQYGLAAPGNAVTATDTIEPLAAATIFEQLLAPYTSERGGAVRVWFQQRPVAARLDEQRAVVQFVATDADDDAPRKTIESRLVVDSTDWGDVIRLSGAEYFAGADPRSRFQESSAPESPTESDRNEMNPISYCLVMRGGNAPQVIDEPPHYDARRYFGSTSAARPQFDALDWPRGVLFLNVPAFVDSAYPEGIYSKNQSIYTQRRLVDARHNQLPAQVECVLFNWVTQDYPLYQFPQWVVDALERTEPGASRKNIVEMTHRQRQIVFADAKAQSLGMIYFLQTLPDQETAEHFQRLRLVDDFGTSDKLPPKPYVREGLRLHALSVLREQDIRTPHAEPRWARVMPDDALLGFQFNIDFHPTRRQFLGDDPNGPWCLIHTPTRNWSTHTDRAMLSARSLVPVRAPRLLGTSKNIGLTSITSAALRLHGQMMLVGQATGALAAECLARDIAPRAAVADRGAIEALQRSLVTGDKHRPGVLLWPFDDLPPDSPHFVAANLLTAWQILPPLNDSIRFKAERPVTRGELAIALDRAIASLDRADSADQEEVELARFTDLPNDSPLARAAGRLFRGHSELLGTKFDAARPVTLAELKMWFQRAKLPLESNQAEGILTRGALAQQLWRAIADLPRWRPAAERYLQPGHDADGDGLADLDDPTPWDRDNNNVPDRLDR